MTLPLYFLDSLGILPAAQPADSAYRYEALQEKATQLPQKATAERIASIIGHPAGKALLQCLFTYSPFLSRLVMQYADFFAEVCILGPDACFASLEGGLQHNTEASATALMKELRIAKNKAALLIAVADIAGAWELKKVTYCMSIIAELAVQRALAFQLREAAHKGLITVQSQDRPESGCGVFVLAMGKLGAHELNYSSDIDLIVFFDRERVRYTGTQNMEQCFSRIVNETVRMLQERTADGYVFRVDLRLRPDPSSTPVALSTAGALTYYETVGQNWERAALIKAHPIAGDIDAGYQFLKQLTPFLWRKHLDFAAIADIQSIKRQMDARTGSAITLPGHNVKTGLGGIREIEFFAQIHQLIWGGRILALRINGTCKTLEALAEEGLISDALAQSLIASYHFLRTVEHRLQMVDDQQTHTIPTVPEAQERLARFMGYDDLPTFEVALLGHLQHVHANFSGAFKGATSLGGEEGTLSFTGVENNPRTLETIAKMGYRNPATVSEIIQGWHRGSRRATRNKRARELITELTPVLLKALAANAQPDQAFMHFDTFLSGLPSGVQIFSLFQANPQLLDLIAIIVGCAPAMAENLSKNPHLLDTVLTADFERTLPDRDTLYNEAVNMLLHARDFEDEIDIIRRFKNERQFQAGVQLLRHQATALEASRTLSDIADICMETLLHRVEVAFREKHPELPLGNLAVLALGRLGARQMTFGSDIDLLFVYGVEGEFPAMHGLYNKLAQRFISALTLLTREGRLYEVDSRLRPSGKDGALAISMEAFDKYVGESAWTFERMAYVRGRVVCGQQTVRKKLQALLTRHLTQPRARTKLVADLLELRGKITREFGSDNPWNLKYAHGGIMDINFLAQFLILSHAAEHPDLIGVATDDIWDAFFCRGILPAEARHELEHAQAFLNSLFAMQRLYGGSTLEGMQASEGMAKHIAKSMGFSTLAEVETVLRATLHDVRKHSALYLAAV
jgi:glutamate-ammonia-ligase adenylyltransferase